MARKLFRQEAIDAQREKLFGEVSIARPVPAWIFTVLAVAIAASLVSFAVWGEYTRRERVDGYLALDTGAARIQLSEAGTLTELFVTEGEEVEAGAPIAKLSLDRSTRNMASTGDAVSRQLNQRIGIIENEQSSIRQLAEQQSEQLKQRIGNLQNELAQADAEIAVQQQRLASAKEQAERYGSLKGFASEMIVQQKRDDATDQDLKLQTLKRQRAGIERDLASARSEMPAVRLRSQAQVEQLHREISELRQDLVQEESRRESVIRAPIAGTVTNIALSRGQSVSADMHLATVVPVGSGLHAELLIPTRAIGFIAVGNQVVVRYEAFPFQRFGQYRGVVSGMSRTVWSPGEKLGPLTVKEPVYRLDVKLDRQSVGIGGYIGVGGQEFELRPGMLIDADILLEKRTVLEWIFEPVLRFKERLG
jgi:membrane fusion protein